MRFAGEVRALSLDDEPALAGAYAVECEATRSVRPGWVPLGQDARVAAWRADNGWTVELLGACEHDRLVGIATSATAHDTPDTAWISASVPPRQRRRGVGRLLVRAAESISPDHVSRFVASAYRPSMTEIERLAGDFAGPLGYTRATTETVVELDLVAAGLPALRMPDGYVVSVHRDGVPDHLQEQVGVLKGLVDAEAPNGELDWQPAPVSKQQYQGEISLWRSQGRTPVESIAVTSDGAVAAWTCLVLAADVHRPAQVEGTIVLAEHRGRRLGKAVKVASLLAARDLGAARVRTSSDDQNVWMRAINDGLGFVPVESEILLQKQRGQPAR